MTRLKSSLRRRLWIAASALSLATVLCVSSTRLFAQDVSPDKEVVKPAEQAARDALTARLKALQNLTAKYKLHETFTPMPGLKEQAEAGNKPGEPRSHVKTEPRNDDCIYRYLDGKYWFETKLVEDEIAAKLRTSETKHQIECFFGDGFERYRVAINDSRPIGFIAASQKTSQLRLHQLVDLGLGVREFDSLVWLTPKDLQTMPARFNPDGMLELQRQDRTGKNHVWQFDAQNGYALKQYTVMWIHSKLKEFEITCSEFGKEGGLVLPHRIEARRFGPGTPGDQRVINGATMKDIEYEFNSPTNTADTFHITWPLGTGILHESSGKSFFVGSKPQVLDEARIKQLLEGNPAGGPNSRGKDAPGEASSEGTAKPAFYTVDHYDDARNAADDLAKSVIRAKAEKKRILLQVGGDWCGWCKLMSNYIETNEKVRENISEHFLLMKVTYNDKQRNEVFLADYPKIRGYPHLFVLESDGKLLHSQGTGELEQGQGYNDKVFLEFLDKWKPSR